MTKPVILYDGVCHLCNGFVRFIIQRDPRKQLLFGHLQSEQSQQRLREFPELTDPMESVILLEGGRVYTRSSAALRIAWHLSGAWPMFYGLTIIPAFLRDVIYNLVAKYRYRIFGRSDQCQLPAPEDIDRFIDGHKNQPSENSHIPAS